MLLKISEVLKMQLKIIIIFFFFVVEKFQIAEIVLLIWLTWNNVTNSNYWWAVATVVVADKIRQNLQPVPKSALFNLSSTSSRLS